MNEMSPEQLRARTKNRRTLIIVLAIFIVPAAFTWLMANLEQFRPTKTKNHGDFIIPIRALQQVALHDDKDNAYGLAEVKGKWTIIYFGVAECDRICEDILYKTRQSRLAQSVEMKRVKRVYVLLDRLPGASLKKILKEHADLSVVTGDKQALDAILRQFEIADKNPAKTAQRVYIIDPLGNLMMSYPKGFSAKGMIKDLLHLLKASRIG